MLKYNKDTINAYINGEDIEYFSIDELENDFNFMKDVISFSNDKEMYHLCSDKLKINYDFVLFIMYKFSDDIKFISQIADYFFQYSEDEIKKMELLIILCDLIKDQHSNEFMKYNLKLLVILKSKEIQIECIKQSSKDKPIIEQEFGKTGFWEIFDEYNSSEIILNYFAHKFIEEIITDGNNRTIEEFIHYQFKTLEKLTETNIRTYLINYLSAYDPMLSSYISTHPSLLNFITEKLDRIRTRWHLFISSFERKKMNQLFELIHNYMQDELEGFYNEDTLIYFAAEELGVFDIVLRNDFSFKDDKEASNTLRESILNFKVSLMTSEDKRHYNYIKALIKKYIQAQTLEELDSIEEPPSMPSQIINFPTLKLKQ